MKKVLANVLERRFKMLKEPGFKSAQHNLNCEGNGSDLVVIEDDFVVASMPSPLTSLGRLLHGGWALTPSNAEAGIKLAAPDRGCEGPLCFKTCGLQMGCDRALHSLLHKPTQARLKNVKAYQRL